VLSLEEAPTHPHNIARATYVEHDGVIQPAPAPRFRHTKPQIRDLPETGAVAIATTLKTWVFSEDELAQFGA
jgi:alpha-methylacyl-CoA racemase